MIKRIILFLLIVLTISSGILFVYRFYEHQVIPNSQQAYTIDNVISYDNIDNYLTSTGSATTHFLLFANIDDENFLYLYNTILNDLNKQTGNLISDNLEVIDCIENVAELDEKWQLKNLPAFISCSIAEDGSLTINNSLQWDDNNPLSLTDVKKWFNDNNIHTGDNIEALEQIAMPTSR